MKINGGNERVKRRYFRYLMDAKRQSPASIDQAAAAIDRFEDFTKRRDFVTFRIEQASAFKDNLAGQLAAASGKPLSAATQLHILSALRVFFIWLADQPGFRARIRYSDADYFNISHKDMAIANAERHTEGPTLAQVRHVIGNMPSETNIEKRNQAVIALALLTGARDNALASLRLKHVDLDKRMIVQDARDVRTKASKTITTWFVPVGEDLVQIVTNWVTHLRDDLHYGLDDPLFPKTMVGLVNGRLGPVGLERACWTTASPIRDIFRKACGSAGLPYFHPHLLRKTLARLGMSICETTEQMKAWSQNIGHDSVMTTLKSYGHVEHVRQRALIADLWRPKEESGSAADLIRQLQKLIASPER